MGLHDLALGLAYSDVNPALPPLCTRVQALAGPFGPLGRPYLHIVASGLSLFKHLSTSTVPYLRARKGNPNFPFWPEQGNRVSYLRLLY